MREDPANSNETVTLADGRSLLLRRLRPDDLDALRRAFRRLTPEEVEYRFFYRSRELPASVGEQVRSLDPARDAAFVIDDAGEVRAVADLHSSGPGAREAEFGLIVGKAIAGNGLGKHLMRRLLAEARARGIKVLRGCVRADNARMLQLCRDLGATVTADPGDATTLVVMFAP